MSTETHELEVTDSTTGKATKFSYNPTSFVCQRQGQPRVLVPLNNVLWAELKDSQVKVSALLKKSRFTLTTFGGIVQPDVLARATSWTDALRAAAYANGKTRLRLKVLVNPAGGQGKGVSIFQKIVEPIFAAAYANCDIVYTKNPGHAQELARTLPLDYDVVVGVSGDGLLHEIFNGFAQRDDACKALRTPVAPIPTGSGNGFCISLLGITEGLDPAAAALNILKGQPMTLDLCSITQGGKKFYSFMSQAMGLVADADLGTENLRWMGNTRFMYGFLRGVAQFKSCPVRISIKAEERDKKQMYEAYQALRTELDSARAAPRELVGEADADEHLPPLRFTEGPDDGWITFDKPLLYAYAGKMPFVSSDFMAFPIAHPCDGFIDLVIQEHVRRSSCFERILRPQTNRGEVLNAITSAAKGGHYWIKSQHYFKVLAYRAQPLGRGFLSVDGEAYPFEEFQVEAHARLATTISMRGRYAVDF